MLFLLNTVLLIILAVCIVFLMMLKRENHALRQKLAELQPELYKASPEASGFTYLALGNSLTQHPLCSYWWDSKCGMAASEPAKDYVHLVTKGLQDKISNVRLAVHGFYLWEVQIHDRAETLSTLDTDLTPEVKLITVQLGENVQDTGTYESDLSELLRYLKAKAPQAQLIVVGDFWSEERNAMRKRAAQQTNCDFADLKEIIGDRAFQCPAGTKVKGEDGIEHTVDHPGVSAHPGDAGMEYIAHAILAQCKL